MPNLTAATSAHTALREAAAALAHGKNANRDGKPLSEPGYQLLAADLARNLEALAAIMHAVRVEPVCARRSPTSREFHELLQQITDVATMAWEAAGLPHHENLGVARTAWSPDVPPDD